MHTPLNNWSVTAESARSGTFFHQSQSASFPQLVFWTWRRVQSLHFVLLQSSQSVHRHRSGRISVHWIAIRQMTKKTFRRLVLVENHFVRFCVQTWRTQRWRSRVLFNAFDETCAWLPIAVYARRSVRTNQPVITVTFVSDLFILSYRAHVRLIRVLGERTLCFFFKEVL